MVQKIVNIVIPVALIVFCGCTVVASKSLLEAQSPEVDQQPGYSVQQLGKWRQDNPDLTSNPIWNILPEGGWENPQDPNMYLLTENGPSDQSSMRKKRIGPNKGGKAPSLSIVNPLDVLRERLLLEIARRRIQQSTSQIQHNEQLLRKIGKRSAHYEDGDSNENSGSDWLRSAEHS